ncbi:ferric reductase-like transmembrane domain-containing protein [bacterium]|nr:ferric reductase-like transmembrane domain-containing protein [bacterium]
MGVTSLVGCAVALALTALVALPLAGALRSHPAPFYGVALAASAAYAWALAAGVDLSGVRWLTVILQKGYLATMLLGVVMFTGVLDEGSPARRHLQPVRGELSVLSFLLVIGHLMTYLPPYLPRLGALMASRTNVALSLLVAIVLALVFAVLAVTSLRAVRGRMRPGAWRAVQRGSYLMVALLALHVALALGRSAASSAQAATSLAAYLAVIAAYAVLRARKVLRARVASRGRVGQPT